MADSGRILLLQLRQSNKVWYSRHVIVPSRHDQGIDVLPLERSLVLPIKQEEEDLHQDSIDRGQLDEASAPSRLKP